MMITVGGGKGGVGKSSIAVNLAVYLAQMGYKVLLVDSDVESPVDHLLLSVKHRTILESVYSFRPSIDEKSCIKCAVCVKRCPEHALIGTVGKLPILLEELCSGCMLCYYICPVKAINAGNRVIGKIYRFSGHGVEVIQGEVIPGVKQHINVTIETIKKARLIADKFDYVIVDSAPGTGAGVWYAMRYSQAVIAVTEASFLGKSDLKRYLELVTKVNPRKFIVVINRADLSSKVTEDIKDMVKSKRAIVFEIPFDENLIKSYVAGKPVVLDGVGPFSKVLMDISVSITSL